MARPTESTESGKTPGLGPIFLIVFLDILGFSLVLPFLAEEARSTFGTSELTGTLLRQRFPEVTVIQGDARNLPLPGRPFRVVANPPYAITADLLDRPLAARTRLVAADLVLQRAVVRKYADQRAPRVLRMSAGLVLPRHAFRPPPRVDSGVLVVRRRS